MWQWQSVDVQQWVWEKSADGSARFVLGTVGLDPLVVFGINPSTAVPNALDPTVARVARFATDNGFDSWTMLNVYPQIATDPDDMHHVHRRELKEENEQHIAEYIDGRPLPLLAAWGVNIKTRDYLPSLLADILAVTATAKCQWVSLGAPTRDGHPRHPLYLRADTPIQPFTMDRYAASICPTGPRR